MRPFFTSEASTNGTMGTYHQNHHPLLNPSGFVASEASAYLYRSEATVSGTSELMYRNANDRDHSLLNPTGFVASEASIRPSFTSEASTTVRWELMYRCIETWTMGTTV